MGLLTWKPAVAFWRVHQAKKALAQGNIQAALSQLEAAESLQPHQAELLYLLGRTYRRADRLELAIQYLEQADSAGYSPEKIRQQRNLLWAQSGRFQRAEWFLKDAIRKGVDDVLAEEIYEALAKGYLKTFRLGDAILCLNYWIEWKSDAVVPRMLLADVWVRADNWNEAATQYEAVIALNPGHLEALSGLADSRFALQDIEAARGQYSRALEVNPDHVPASLGLAKCDCRLAHTEAAAARFESLLQNKHLTEQQRVDTLVEFSQIRMRDQRDPEGALSLLREAESLAPNHHHVHVMLASVHRRLGREAAALQYEDKAAVARKRLEQLSGITRSLIKSPKDAGLRYEAGMLFMEQGMKREGAEWLSTAVIFDPEHRDAHLALARYYEETGEHKIAGRHRQMAGK